MLLLCELEITVLNCNQFSPLVTLTNDYMYFYLWLRFIFCIRVFKKVSGLPHVTDPQSLDGIHLILLYLHLELLVIQVLHVHCNNPLKTLGTGSNTKSFSFN